MEIKKGLGAVGIVAACAACCAPLLLPMLSGVGVAAAGTAGASALFGLPADVVICGGLAAATLTGIGLWSYLQSRKAAAKAACACKAGIIGGCAPAEQQTSRAAMPRSSNS
jgi:hypothetical protein